MDKHMTSPSVLPQQPCSPPLTPEASIAPDADLHNVSLGRWTQVGARCILNNVQVGDYSYIQNDCDLMFTELGKFVSVASHVRINPSNHPWWRPTLHHFTYRPGKYGFAEPGMVDEEVFSWRHADTVRIGHDVWIGHGAILLPGANVGNGAIIGAGSVVTKDVPAWQIVVGNPAKVLRPRFAKPDTAARLEEIAWWHWPEEVLKERWALFQGSAEEFIERATAFA